MKGIDSLEKHSLLQLISFTIGDEEYGVEVLEVIEVVRLPKIQRLPKCEDYLKGIINLRGEVIPIVDLRMRFGLSEKNDDNIKRTIIVKVNERKIGMIVDSVSKVIRVTSENIREATNFSSLISNDYISGIVMKEDKMLILIDLKSIFTENDMEQFEEIVESGS